jgi:hypothetical protein
MADWIPVVEVLSEVHVAFKRTTTNLSVVDNHPPGLAFFLIFSIEPVSWVLVEGFVVENHEASEFV